MSESLLRSGSTDNSTFQTARYYYDPGHVLWNTQEQRVSTFINMFQGYRTPRYHERMRAGDFIPYTAWGRFDSFGESTGHWSMKTSDGKYWYCDHAYNEVGKWAITEESYLRGLFQELNFDSQILVQGAASKIYSEGYDLLTSLAELADVRNMFVGLAKNLLTLIIKGKIRASKNPLGRLEDVFQSWLSVRYGWRTLIHDMQNINELIQKWNETKERYSARCVWKYSKTTLWTEDVNSYYYDAIKVYSEEINIQARGSVAAEIHVPKLLLNPIATAWELIPLSFVVDWFWTVGKSIEALSFLAMQRQHTACSGFKITVKRDFDLALVRMKNGGSNGDIWQKASCTASLIERTPCSVPFTPQTRVRLDSYKVTDLVALAYTHIRRI